MITDDKDCEVMHVGETTFLYFKDFDYCLNPSGQWEYRMNFQNGEYETWHRIERHRVPLRVRLMARLEASE